MFRLFVLRRLWPALTFLLAVNTTAQVSVEAIVASERPIIETVPLTGSVSALRLSSLSSEVSGLVRLLKVEAGDAVDRGDVILELAPELTRLSLESAEGQLRRARAMEAEASRRLSEAEDLIENNNIAASEVRSREAAYQSAQAEREVAEAERDLAAAELERHTLVAPFAGTISQKFIDVGEWVTPGAALVELVSTEQLRVDFQVPQRYFHRVDREAAVALALDSAPENTFQAEQLRKVPLSRAGARTFLLRATLPGGAPEAIPGMSVSGRLSLSAGRESVTVPRDALLRYPDGRISVWVADSDNFGAEVTVSEVQVETGMAFEGQVEIRRGLKPGQVVITRGNEALQAQQTVELRRAQPQ